ncbi:hypothetical protein ACFXC8_00515 [Streptomyces sp. NPDC059441]|uniref:hypothetical protein n=1 Tax=Streptomyces sp. NPDC059441 TaxID=3346829 RepID=UPI003673A59A
MASYVITGRNKTGEPVLSVNVDSISQEPPVVDEVDVVNAVRAFIAGTAGVFSVVAQKYEQVITTV